MTSSRGSCRSGMKTTSPASPALRADSLLLSHQGSPWILNVTKLNDLLSKYEKWRGYGKGNLVTVCYWRNLWNIISSKWSILNNHTWLLCASCDISWKSFHLCGTVSNNSQSQSNNEKCKRNLHWGNSTKCLTSTPQAIKFLSSQTIEN